MLKAIIFDFDGVIAESVEVKIDAFRRIFEDYPQHLDQILAYHTANGGISRYVKFDYIYKEILNKPLNQDQSRQLGDRFTQYALEEVVRAPLVAGAKEFLEKYHQTIKLFIVSGTPQDEMLLIAQRRGLNHFFKGIYGSPRSKAELNRLILDEHALKSNEVLFVGDSLNDYEGAQAAGLQFIGRLHPGEPHLLGKGKVKSTISDLRELETLLIKQRLL